MAMQKALDLDAVRAFILIADLGSFTRAAEVLEVAQAAVSLKLKRLERQLGCRLLDRTPRHVRLSGQGREFIEPARELLAAHERAVAGTSAARPQRLTIGISDHVAGPELPIILARLNAYDPSRIIEMRIAASRELAAAFDQRELDAAIVRREDDRRRGKPLFEDRMGWFAAPTWKLRAGMPLPLANMAAPCGVRAIATRALDSVGVPWTEVFVGGGVMAVGAAVSAGVAVAALAARVAPPGSVDVGPQLGLPALPASEVVVHSRLREHRAQELLRVLGAAFRAGT